MEWIRQLLGVGFVLALLGACLFWLRRRGLASSTFVSRRRDKAARLELIERVTLTPQHSVHLVRMGGRAILIGRAPGGLSRLASAPWNETEASR